MAKLPACLGSLLLFSSALWAQPSEGQPTVPPPALSPDQVVQQVEQADQWRTTALQNYTVMRRYRVENKRFHKQAEMVVRITYSSPGTKRFEVISESGSGAVRRLALRRLIQAEERNSQEAVTRKATRITTDNYVLQLKGTDEVGGHACYQLEAKPIGKSELLFNGRIWVEAHDFAVVQIEGSPAKNPSFWLTKVRFTHHYTKLGPYWLPVSDQSDSNVRIFGPTEVTVEYYDYRINQPTGPADARERSSK
jgi:outer membrane lipoprotein-sorting protein